MSEISSAEEQLSTIYGVPADELTRSEVIEGIDKELRVSGRTVKTGRLEAEVVGRVPVDDRHEDAVVAVGDTLVRARLETSGHSPILQGVSRADARDVIEVIRHKRGEELEPLDSEDEVEQLVEEL